MACQIKNHGNQPTLLDKSLIIRYGPHKYNSSVFWRVLLFTNVVSCKIVFKQMCVIVKQDL